MTGPPNGPYLWNYAHSAYLMWQKVYLSFFYFQQHVASFQKVPPLSFQQIFAVLIFNEPFADLPFEICVIFIVCGMLGMHQRRSIMLIPKKTKMHDSNLNCGNHSFWYKKQFTFKVHKSSIKLHFGMM